MTKSNTTQEKESMKPSDIFENPNLSNPPPLSLVSQTPLTSTLIEFLRESNAIEDVYDDDSLNQAFIAMDYLLSEIELSPGVILKTHKILMHHQDLLPDEKGYFRTVPVWVGGREGIKYNNIPAAIKSWCLVANESKSEEHIKKDHIDYEQIHPFIDGNGRTGRMLLNYQRIKNGLPILVIKEAEKQDYYKWFRNNLPVIG